MQEGGSRGIEIRTEKRKGKLSAAGKIIIAAVVLLAILFVGINIHTKNRGHSVYTAVEQCVSVYKVSTSSKRGQMNDIR